MTPSLCSINMLEWLTDLGEKCVTSLLKDVISHADEQPDLEIFRARSGRV